MYAVFPDAVDETDDDDVPLTAAGDVVDCGEFDTCLAATIAALAMLSTIEDVNKKRMRSGSCPLRFGIGIDFGVICHAKLRGLTVNVGMPANTAQRLEELNKDPVVMEKLLMHQDREHCGLLSSIAISEAVYDVLPEVFSYSYGEHRVDFEKRWFIDLGRLLIRGISNPIQAYGTGFVTCKRP